MADRNVQNHHKIPKLPEQKNPRIMAQGGKVHSVSRPKSRLYPKKESLQLHFSDSYWDTPVCTCFCVG